MCFMILEERDSMDIRRVLDIVQEMNPLKHISQKFKSQNFVLL